MRGYRQAGKLRPTQIVSQHGPGAIVDLPELSVVIAGLHEWRHNETDRISEPRLEAFLGATALYRPARPASRIPGGVPAFVFPEWLVCPNGKCRLLARREQFEWNDRTGEYICQRTHIHGSAAIIQAFPARFLIACPRGHLDDFPWDDWIHAGARPNCRGPFRLEDEGRSGSVSDLVASCQRCGSSRRMSEVFEPGALAACSGRRPWLGLSNHEQDCDADPRVLLRGASNAYFSIVASALSIPPYAGPIQLDIAPFLETLGKLTSADDVIATSKLGLLDDLLARYAPEQLLAAAKGGVTELQRLRPDEYKAFLDPPAPVQPPHEFQVRRVEVPNRSEARKLALVRAATRLREVRALRGFTRIESGLDIGDLADVAELNIDIAPLGPANVRWRPAVELRGEGIFLALDEQSLQEWENRVDVADQSRELTARLGEFHASRSTPENSRRPFPGMRYVLLHSLAHALIRRLCLNAGYSSSALRERIYSSSESESMAGLLIYTASSDSEGSLGGLVDQAEPDCLGAVLVDALLDTHLCAQDPLCGSGEFGGTAGLNGAACHACLLLSETSCEAGNRFLDRAVLAETVGQFGRGFFRGA
ncbi:MAG: DUF1998 domain-containing protein [Acidimicrobiaceae bacterium]|nr:DUF1998 domain-containing protein [Acidimicrobiaceae bacterium]